MQEQEPGSNPMLTGYDSLGFPDNPGLVIQHQNASDRGVSFQFYKVESDSEEPDPTQHLALQKESKTHTDQE